ncbi:MAG: hypothetical protein HYV14_05095 [Elusimicrobia bacterium]|nr:hypothetical protein [Elusimicrobiota bacterium]
MNTLFIAVLLAFGVSGAHAQMIRPDHQDLATSIANPELRAMAEQVLQRKNHYYVQEALRNLEEL